MEKKKLLLVSPFPNDQDLYPHLKYLIDELSFDYEIDYFYMHERGLWIENIIYDFIKDLKVYLSYKRFLNLIKDIYFLYQRSFHEKYDIVVAIDNFLYVLSSLILKQEVLLWSHDLVGYDEPRYYCRTAFIHRLIAKFTKKLLTRNKKLIIQDKERLGFLLKSIEYNGTLENVFFLPVSLPPIQLPKKELKIESKVPTLMQSGSIASWRGSDALIQYYQQNFEQFNLFLHGFISDEIQELLGKLEVLPLVSALKVLPDKVPQLIQQCDIGFINYAIEDLNHFYTSNASGQFVEFLRCGKPVIVQGKTNLQQYVEEEKIGVSIIKIDELASAIHKITSNYSEYSSNCIKTFEKNIILKSMLKSCLYTFKD
ncbi:MAG: glycosyltransferase family 4 protein [Scytonema sp. RU_4_4]|nr:glycosyltransferase family 4 protein [Scytonema sp. RU_4_4]